MNKYIIPIFAVIDSSSFLIYLFDLSNNEFYSATLAVKIILLIFHRRSSVANDLLYVQALLYIIIVGGVANSVLGSGWNELDTQAFGFVAHLICTCWVVNSDNFRRYFSGCANVILLCNLLFIVMYFTGHTDTISGRTRFFGTQPNLGGEIFAAGVFTSLISQGVKRNAVQSLAAIFAVLVLEARAAIVAIALMNVFKFVDVFSLRRGAVTKIIFSAPAAMVIIVVWQIFSDSVFLFDDPYRGLGTNLVGRLDRWEFGWNAFLSAPIFGNGYSFYNEYPDLSAHNFFIYLVALFGVFGILIIVIYIFLGFILYRNFPPVGRVVLGFAVLTIFNDRLFNLNPYPFYLHVILLAVPRIGGYWNARENPRVQTPEVLYRNRAIDPPVRQPQNLPK